ncbi:MAG: hypothetical protein VX278_07160 [Myxococcota bacterium]|nr:hypothetical protein [Myxococcota bacterium]
MVLLFALLSSLAHAITTASSTLKDEDGTHKPSHAVDGLLSTGWSEGVSGNGAGEWLELKLNKTTEIQTLSIWPGNYQKGRRSYREYARPKIIRIFVDGEQQGNPRRIQDKMKRFDFGVNTKGKTIKILIDDAYPGIVSEDLFIAEIAVNFTDRSAIKRYDQWLESKTAQREKERLNQKVKENYNIHIDSELSDKKSLDFLCDAGSDGPLYLRKKVSLFVPEGYRIQALDANDKAREALRKLKNANAIPCLERAALRARGKEAKKRWSHVNYYYAIRELIGGKNLMVPPWSQTGWSEGELQSFGEPLSLEISPFGMVWVADTGNNRIQVFNENGRMEKIYGQNKPSITNKWFKKGRPWYVSGSPAEKKGGLFINPVDIVFIPQKKDLFGFASLDANGRIQVFNDKGEVLRSWKMDHSYPASAKMGGTAYLLYIKRKKALCAIIQESGKCYKLDSEQISEFELQDGTPTAAEVLPNGKLLLAFNDKLIQYSIDGFRHRILIDKTKLGPSFEYLDMTLDEKNKLWVLTDYGDLFKFKNPRKIDFQIRITETPLAHPRIAVEDDMLYLLFEDHIEVFDVRQALIDREEAQKAADEKSP